MKGRITFLVISASNTQRTTGEVEIKKKSISVNQLNLRLSSRRLGGYVGSIKLLGSD